MVGEPRSRVLLQACDTQKRMPLLFSLPSPSHWAGFAAALPRHLLHQGRSRKAMLPRVLRVCVV